MINPIYNFYKNSTSFNKLMLNNIFVNIVYSSCIAILIAAISVLIAYLSLDNYIYNYMLWITIGLLCFVLIFFYIFQFLVRKAKYNIESIINFKWLYERNLIDSKQINDKINDSSIFNKDFINIYVELIKNLYENATLGNQYEAYEFLSDKTKHYFSICNIKIYSNSFWNKYKSKNIMIFTDNNRYLINDLYISQSKIDNNSVFGLQKVECDNLAISYFSNSEINSQNWEWLNSKISNYNDNFKMSIRIIDGIIYYIFESDLNLNFQNQKWFNKNKKYFINKYENCWKVISDFFKIIN